MSNQQESPVKNTITSESFWIRTAYLVLFLVLYSVIDILVYLVTIGQWFSVLLKGEPTEELTKFGHSLSEYLAQIVAFLSASSEHKPFPFSDWPKSE